MHIKQTGCDRQRSSSQGVSQNQRAEDVTRPMLLEASRSVMEEFCLPSLSLVSHTAADLNIRKSHPAARGVGARC